MRDVVMKDHPRTCGEKPNRLLAVSLMAGSPPHMRGKGRKLRTHLPPEGITPAHAGKSGGDDFLSGLFGDHPRTCGEKICMQLIMGCCTGSPPHMRGKGDFTPFRPVETGITPAHAGKSVMGCFGAPLTGDHPRTCGEKQTHTPNGCICTGSPPHMRGKDGFTLKRLFIPGITPAHAGKRVSFGR